MSSTWPKGFRAYTANIGVKDTTLDFSVVLGDPGVHVLDDDWTVVASGGSHASHWEHTVAITEDGPWVLTALDDVRL